jgi:hypothetical protein
MMGKENNQEYECVRCGATVREDDKFCPKCGDNIEEIINENISSSEDVQSPTSAGNYGAIMIKGRKYWQCSGCGSISSKENSVGFINMAQELGARSVIANDIICSKCNTRTALIDILEGKFDVRDSDELVEMMLKDPVNVKWHRWRKKWSYKGKMLQGSHSFGKKVKPKNAIADMVHFTLRKAEEEAKEWWAANPSKTNGRCDRCSGLIRRGEGYLVGPKQAYIHVQGSPEAQKQIYDVMISSGLASTPDMVCKNCLIKYSEGVQSKSG